MEKEVLVKVEGVSKKFCRDLKRSLAYGVQDLTKEILRINRDQLTLRKHEFWAVKDISFELRRGECLGLIGHNGAGKSTLLKMLNGLIKPEVGKITMRGKISALIELGAGFNPVLTGRENILINGQILGFSKEEVDKKFIDIVAFSEIEEFIDTPVQNYSSGMKIRLGFAIAAQLEPDVLILDEVLAVGDEAFKIKCLNSITSLLTKCAVIFVTHSMVQLSKICTGCLLLDHGSVKHYSNQSVSDVITSYLKGISTESNRIMVSNGVSLTNISIVIQHDKNLSARLTLNFERNCKSCFVLLVFRDKLARSAVAVVENPDLSQRLDDCLGEVKADISIVNQFTSGIYTVDLNVFEYTDDNRMGNLILRVNNCSLIKNLTHGFDYKVPIRLKSTWSIAR